MLNKSEKKGINANEPKFQNHSELKVPNQKIGNCAGGTDFLANQQRIGTA